VAVVESNGAEAVSVWKEWDNTTEGFITIIEKEG
jgi:hypothetical protein